MWTSNDYLEIKGITKLAERLVEERNHLLYLLVYSLIILALILPVPTASVEWEFSVMKIVKQRLCSEIGDKWLGVCLLPYIEKEGFVQVPNETIMQCYQNMRTWEKQL